MPWAPVGQTVEFIDRIDAGPAVHAGSITELRDSINVGDVDTLIILGSNPAYDAPANLEFAYLLLGGKVRLQIHLGLYNDETARICHWHIPEAHALEAWGDLRAFDGTATIQQPLIAPLYSGKSAIEVMAMLLGEEPARLGLEFVRDYWRRQGLPGDFEATWRQSLRKGVIAGSARKPKAVTPNVEAVKGVVELDRSTPPGEASNWSSGPDPAGQLGRPIRQQRLARIAQADDATDLFDNAAARQPGPGDRSWAIAESERGSGIVELAEYWQQAAWKMPGLHHARSGRGIGHRHAGLRAPACWPGWRWGRRRRVSAPHRQCALVRVRSRGRQDVRNPALSVYRRPPSTTTEWKAAMSSGSPTWRPIERTRISPRCTSRIAGAPRA